ncbi:ABC transporter substrate-binding protein [Vibrio tapetis]|uniref:Putative ABC-type uncharacterized transport system, periplasmic component n=1 Tax=Vibrio tapetis subsp. tapetis TaxID=1671868 RepID=A0A2N8ZIT9_9VIBR|nr:ABC transporter substrate binding protein [Vibrio tapetis]SON51822.1 putative ABC-type uncharacterized transport system, periplasmic component [Vibrio tapetis subsp. tapetis]
MKQILLLLLVVSSSSFAQTKVLYINSYHEDFYSAIIQIQVVKDILLPEDIQLKFVHMDTKRIKEDELRKIEGLKVQKVIAEWKPDLVIASDDSASKYVVSKYKDQALPFVFMGVNWSAEQYGYPYENVTGQIEVDLAKELISELQTYATGKRVAFLSGDTLTDRKTLNFYQTNLDLTFSEVKLVNTFEEWKSAYSSLQEQVDVILFLNNAGIKNWNDQEAEELVKNETKIPTGTTDQSLHPYVLISFAKDVHEFGEYGAKTALQILNGTSPTMIPITKNTRAKISLNMSLAKKLGVIFPIEMIDMATLVD